MARPLRLEFPKATYHVMARGNNRQTIFLGEPDYERFLELLGRLTEKFAVRPFAYCLMGNHYHLLLETPLPNLQKALQYLNSAYSIYFNRHHKRVGHLLQGRYKALLVEKENYLLELTRYVHLNPVRAGIVNDPGKYDWSSYGRYRGAAQEPRWLEVSEVLERFGSQVLHQRASYKRFVEDRMDEKVKENPLSGAVFQCLLGGKGFVDRMKSKLEDPGPEVAHRQGLMSRDPEKITAFIRRQQLGRDREEKVLMYFLRRYTALTLREVCDRLGGGHYSRVAQAVRRLEQERANKTEAAEMLSRLDRAMSNIKV